MLPILDCMGRLRPKEVSERGGYAQKRCLRGEAAPKRGVFFRLEEYKMVEISCVAEWKRVQKTVFQVFQTAF